ncbi:hypothetical protein D6D01_10438 [Aureobasidium pullulans]|uniref:Uncharacterized protein n=1 Tax=Aureobasidium pullulans TaxID=5580 RepID=A0A4S9JCH5_AURPU|nr:hypothetical protein D6D01_10438 [Aureobasidium pullulans]
MAPYRTAQKQPKVLAAPRHIRQSTKTAKTVAKLPPRQRKRKSVVIVRLKTSRRRGQGTTALREIRNY